MTEQLLCPRRAEGGPGPRLAGAHDQWRANDTCSYCGSISPEEFFRVVESGGLIEPTDKNYKAYVEDANPAAGKPRIVGTTNAERGPPGWTQVTAENLKSFPDWESHLLKPGLWVQVAPDSPTRTRKFYFQHVSGEERTRFIESLNAGKMRLAYPGHFYRLPFFVQRLDRAAASPPAGG